MMCPQCGLPVSPSRTACPRCGISVKEMMEKASSGQNTPLFSQNRASPLKLEESKSAQKAQPAIRSSRVFPNVFLYSSSKARLGFTIAGICIVTGVLILIVVLVTAQSSPRPARVQVPSVHQNKLSQIQPTAVPTPSPVPSPTIASVKPTPPSAPGSKYITNVQLGAAMNADPVAITWPTTDFKMSQRIYITMNVNSAGYQGAVCLDWYVGNAFLTHYAFPTMADPGQPHSTAWSYATSMRQGPGYVDVFWASSLACVDKVLAQRVNFNVTG